MASTDAPAPEQAGIHAPGPVRVVRVVRRPDIEEARSKLPITGMEQEVVEAVLYNDVIMLCGETGCGKTTQVKKVPM